MRHLLKIKGLVILLLVATLTVPKAYAEDALTFNTSNYSEEMVSLRFSGSDIIITSLPNRDDFNYILIELFGEDGIEYDQEWALRQNEITYSTSGVDDGIYNFDLYHSSVQDRDYIWVKSIIKVNIKDGKVTPVYAMTYNNNKTIYNKYKNDKITLLYYLQPSAGVMSTNKEIIKLAKSIVLESDSDYEKIKKVHDWVAHNVWYNWDGYLNGNYGENNALTVYHSKKAVCQGYANLTAAILRALGLPTKVVSGYTLGLNKWSKKLVDGNQKNHAWNEVFVNNRWIIIDTTWDSGNAFINGEFQDTGVDNYRYFDATIESFSNDHKMYDSSDEVIDYEKNLKYFTMSTKNITLYNKGSKARTKQIGVDVDYNKLEISLSDWYVTYKTSNKSIATVSKNGWVTAKKAGRATITATVIAGTLKKEFKIEVTVK